MRESESCELCHTIMIQPGQRMGPAWLHGTNKRVGDEYVSIDI